MNFCGKLVVPIILTSHEMQHRSCLEAVKVFESLVADWLSVQIY